jgi:tetratricopeptide (TPR) repeat protein
VVSHYHSVSLGELPPPPLGDCFGRNELIEEVVGLAENLEPIALIGAGGIGKTSIALTVLHHNRIKQRFGENRRFLRCDQFLASRAQFLARLSKVIGAGVENPEDLTPLLPSLSSKETLIVLDNAESVLDPQGTGAREIYSVVDELCRFKNICLLITSRITTVPPRCKRPEIPTLSMEASCEIFYHIYGNRGKSGIINDLLYRLDFHALSITLLATTAAHNLWDHDRLAKEWDAQRAQVLQTVYNESLAATIELSLVSPTFRGLGPSARDLLGVIAFFPQGIDERNLDWLFPTISNRHTLFDIFCLLSLTYRSNGFVTMLAPIRDYLLPQDPRSSPLLCTTRDHYFTRLSVDADPDNPGSGETRWVLSEDVNVEHLLDVFTPIGPSTGDVWDACYHFMIHLSWHKPRLTTLGSKIEALSDDHPSKPKCLSQLSKLLGQVGNYVEQKRLTTLALELERRRKDDVQIAATLRRLSNVNRLLHLHKEGIQEAKEALEIFERIGDTIGQARCLTDLASLLLDDNRLDAAEDAALRAMDLVPDQGQEHLVCSAHRTLGDIHRSKGEKEKAINHFEAALRIAANFNWHGTLFWNHYSLAELFSDGSEWDDANAQIEQAKSHAINNPDYLGRASLMQARIWSWQQRLEDAKLEASHALEIFEKLGNERLASRCRIFLQKVEGAMKKRSTRLPGGPLKTILPLMSVDFHFLV